MRAIQVLFKSQGTTNDNLASERSRKYQEQFDENKRKVQKFREKLIMAERNGGDDSKYFLRF